GRAAQPRRAPPPRRRRGRPRGHVRRDRGAGEGGRALPAPDGGTALPPGGVRAAALAPGARSRAGGGADGDPEADAPQEIRRRIVVDESGDPVTVASVVYQGPAGEDGSIA